MKNIFVITVTSRLEQDDLGWPCLGSVRTVGFYPTFDDADLVVKNNVGDICEYSYSYAIIEEVEPGVYPYTPNRWFYEYDCSQNGYAPIEEPEFMEHICNIGIG